jgi:hypothetical protein
MEYQIIPNVALAVGIFGIVLVSAAIAAGMTYYLAIKVRKRHIISHLPQHIKDQLADKDIVIREKNAVISRINDQYQAERARNIAAMLTAQRLERILTADDPNSI